MPTQTTTRFRVIQILTNDFGAYNNGTPSKVTETTKWEGDDIVELSKQFPPSEIYGADPLDHSEIEDGLIRYDYRFEQFIDGQWTEIEDPRVRQRSAPTALERAIDAENRRLYPGDYEDVYDDERCDNCDRYYLDCRC